MNIPIVAILKDFHVILSILFILTTLLWGDWKNYKLYYPSVLFFVSLNLYYDFITYNYPLWEFESPLLKSVGSDILTNLTIFPATTLIYLPHILRLKTFNRRIIYIVFWVVFYTLLEVFSLQIGYFSHHNGWNIWWSLFINCLLFPLLLLHHRRPILSWSISLILSFLILLHFDFPFDSIK